MSILIELLLTFGLSYIIYILGQKTGTKNFWVPAFNLLFPLVGLIWITNYAWKKKKGKVAYVENVTITRFPPGFRSKKPWKIAVAIILYLAIGLWNGALSYAMSQTSPGQTKITSTPTTSVSTDVKSTSSSLANSNSLNDSKVATDVPTTTQPVQPNPQSNSSMSNTTIVSSPAPVQKNEQLIVTAQISNPSPTQNSTEHLSVTVTSNGKPVSGANVAITCHYKTKDTDYSGVTSSDGIANISFRISRATKGYTVDIDIVVKANGNSSTAKASFTPQ